LKAGNWNKIEVLEAEETRFEVFEANFGQSRWARVTTLGDDQVLFLCDGSADLSMFLRRRCQGHLLHGQ
jgi:hypothetical protein